MRRDFKDCLINIKKLIAFEYFYNTKYQEKAIKKKLEKAIFKIISSIVETKINYPGISITKATQFMEEITLLTEKTIWITLTVKHI